MEKESVKLLCEILSLYPDDERVQQLVGKILNIDGNAKIKSKEKEIGMLVLKDKLGAKFSELENSQKEILNIREAADFVGLSVSRLYALTCHKKIPHYKLNGKGLRFKRSELEEWLTRDRVATNEEIETKERELRSQK